MRPGLRLGAILLRRQQGREIAKISRPGHPKVSNHAPRKTAAGASLLAGCKTLRLALHPGLARRFPVSGARVQRWWSPVWFLPTAARNTTARHGTIGELWWSSGP